MKKLFRKLRELFQQGTSAHGLALSTTLGISFGLFPVLGITTWLIPIIGLRLRLNIPLMLTLSYLVWPLQIFLIVPFLRFGEWIWELPPFPLSVEKLQVAFEASVLDALNDFWFANVTAVGGWLMAAVPIGAVLYFVLLKVFGWMLERRKVG